MQSITKQQIGLMQDLLRMRFDRLAWVTADATKDEPNAYARYTETNLAIDGLVKLGLVEDITNGDEARPLMDSLSESGRQFKVYHITDVGRQLFEASEVSSQRVN